MGELNNLTLSVVFTILGGLVAGMVGYVATMVSLREQRKQRHLEEHKENLRSVSKAIDQARDYVWPFVYGGDSLHLPKSPFGNEKKLQNLQIQDVEVVYTPIGGVDSFSQQHNNYVQVGVDIILFEDIPAHFPKLSKLLIETEEDIKKNGIIILRLLNSLSKKIYDKLNNGDIDFPNLNPTSPNEKVKFSELNDDSIKSDYAGSVFLMVIGEDEDNWPNKSRFLRNNQTYDQLRKLSNEVEKENTDDLNHLHELKDILFQNINKTHDEIKSILHKTKLTGRCNYI